MKKLQVIYNGWGEHWLLGMLADTEQGILFEYSQQAIARGLQLSPMHQQLQNRSLAVGMTYLPQRNQGGGRRTGDMSVGKHEMATATLKAHKVTISKLAFGNCGESSRNIARNWLI